METSEEKLRELMISGLGGNAVDHAALLRLLVPLLRGFCQRRANGSADDIEDLVQETLIVVHDRRSTYDRSRSFKAWLFAIARYKMIDHFRRTRRLHPLEGMEEALTTDGFENASIARIDLDDLLETLPSKQARMIRATRIEGLSIAEAAAMDGIGESDVKVSAHRGMKSLMKRIQGSGR